MIINRIDPEFKFASVFNTKNGHYVRSNVKGTGEDAFMSSFPELLDIGIMGRCNNAHFCLDENTSILMGDRRSKKIKDIIVGDEVLSLGKTSIITDKVVRTISSESTEQFEINISTKNGDVTLIVTGTHPILTKRGWVKASELNENDEVIMVE